MIACPDCRGKGFCLEAHNWSDGLGMVEMRCGLCDGTGKVDPIAELRALKATHGVTAGALADLKKHVLCYVDTLDPKNNGLVRGMPGASPHKSTWLEYLKKSAASTAKVLEAEMVKMETSGHDDFHVPTGKYYRELPSWPCPATNARKYCSKCS